MITLELTEYCNKQIKFLISFPISYEQNNTFLLCHGDETKRILNLIYTHSQKCLYKGDALI